MGGHPAPPHPFILQNCVYDLLNIPKRISVSTVMTHWEKLLGSDWLRDCEFIRNVRTNSVIRGKLQISRAKSVILSEYKYKKELTIRLLISD